MDFLQLECNTDWWQWLISLRPKKIKPMFAEIYIIFTFLMLANMNCLKTKKTYIFSLKKKKKPFISLHIFPCWANYLLLIWQFSLVPSPPMLCKDLFKAVLQTESSINKFNLSHWWRGMRLGVSRSFSIDYLCKWKKISITWKR